jgi:hypothetical protein
MNYALVIAPTMAAAQLVIRDLNLSDTTRIVLTTVRSDLALRSLNPKKIYIVEAPLYGFREVVRIWERIQTLQSPETPELIYVRT